MPNQNIKQLIERDDKIFLVSDIGFSIIDSSDDSVINYNTEVNSDTQILSDNVRQIGINREDFLFAATQNGLVKIDLSNDEKTILTTDNGLPSNDINSIFIKPNSELVIATINGLAITKDNGDTFIIKNTENGLPSNNIKSVYANSDTYFTITEEGISITLANDFSRFPDENLRNLFIFDFFI